MGSSLAMPYHDTFWEPTNVTPTREKNPVSRFGYNDTIVAYHYTFMMKVAADPEPESFAKAAKNRHGTKQWTRRCKHLARTRHGISSLTHLTRRKSVADGYITWSINYADGSINRYKARLVAKGYMHKCTVSTMKRPLPQWRRWQLFEP